MLLCIKKRVYKKSLGVTVIIIILYFDIIATKGWTTVKNNTKQVQCVISIENNNNDDN